MKPNIYSKSVSTGHLVFDFYGLRCEAVKTPAGVLVRFARQGHTQSVLLPKAAMDVRLLRARMEGALAIPLPAGGSVAFYAASWPRRRRWLAVPRAA